MPLLKCSASKARPKNGIRYITDPKKAAIVSVRNLFEDEDYAKQFEETAARFCKGEKYDERKYYHFKLSCARKDNVTPEKAHSYAEEIAEAFFKNYECVIATHTDTKTVLPLYITFVSRSLHNYSSSDESKLPVFSKSIFR